MVLFVHIVLPFLYTLRARFSCVLHTVQSTCETDYMLYVGRPVNQPSTYKALWNSFIEICFVVNRGLIFKLQCIEKFVV